jgi:diguanylate cyclase (GGDEF)-like protein
MFDDYQAPAGSKYVVKELGDDEAVLPSTRSVQPVPAATKEEKAKEFEISDFFDLDSDIYLSELEPRAEFNFLLGKTLVALREVLFAHSVSFFWVNHDKQQLVLESKATDSQNFGKEKRYPLERDIVSQVAREGKPEFHGRMTPLSEREFVSYYESVEYIKSVVAVPVFFSDGSKHRIPVGVIAADSKAEDAFGAETLGLLGNFTKLVSALIKSYTGKYDLLLDSEMLSSLRRMQDRIKSQPCEQVVLTSLADEAHRLLNWDFLTLSMYGEERQGWVMQKVVNRAGTGYVTPDQMIDFNGSIVGKTIRTNKVEMVEDWTLARPVRFYPEEQIESSGSFLCVPISSFNRCYGALTLESKNRNNFSGNEVETIYRLVESAAATLEVLYMNDLVKEYVIIDQLTGSFKQNHFLKKLDQEVERANDFGDELALVSVEIDARKELSDRHGKEGFDAIINQIVRLVRANTRAYDVIGLLEGERLGVLMINTAASDAYLWAEKMRKQIASNIISLGPKSFSVTISAGVCGLMDGMRNRDLLDGTAQVLHKAVEGGGNLVRVF